MSPLIYLVFTKMWRWFETCFDQFYKQRPRTLFPKWAELVGRVLFRRLKYVSILHKSCLFSQVKEMTRRRVWYQTLDSCMRRKIHRRPVLDEMGRKRSHFFSLWRRVCINKGKEYKYIWLCPLSSVSPFCIAFVMWDTTGHWAERGWLVCFQGRKLLEGRKQVSPYLQHIIMGWIGLGSGHWNS